MVVNAFEELFIKIAKFYSPHEDAMDIGIR